MTKYVVEPTIDELIAQNIEDRTERIAVVAEWIDMQPHRPDDSELERLADYVLREELTDPNPYKVMHSDYPILSEEQLKNRRKREVPLDVAGDIPTGYVETPRHVDLLAWQLKKIKAECARYTRINKRTQVHSKRATPEELARIQPHPYARFRGLEHVEWSLDVRRRDGFTCQKCGIKGRKGLHAHHIEAYNVAIDLRYDVNNGITLCKKCHREFHDIYGRGNNTREQLTEWMEAAYACI